MFTDFLEGFRWLLGLDVEDYNAIQMAVRAIVIYISTLVMIRVGEKRFLGKNTAFDVILGVVLGSMVSRSINGVPNLFPTIVAGFTLVGLHWLFASMAFRSKKFASILRGSVQKIVQDGEILWDGMKKGHLTKSDLLSSIRTNTKSNQLQGVKEAYLELNGSISIVKPSQLKVLEIEVQEGVQTIRIQLE
jgi:uncharacterized membrane protein YcaP (DUF421 family)